MLNFNQKKKLIMIDKDYMTNRIEFIKNKVHTIIYSKSGKLNLN